MKIKKVLLKLMIALVFYSQLHAELNNEFIYDDIFFTSVVDRGPLVTIATKLFEAENMDQTIIDETLESLIFTAKLEDYFSSRGLISSKSYLYRKIETLEDGTKFLQSTLTNNLQPMLNDLNIVNHEINRLNGYACVKNGTCAKAIARRDLFLNNKNSILLKFDKNLQNYKKVTDFGKSIPNELNAGLKYSKVKSVSSVLKKGVGTGLKGLAYLSIATDIALVGKGFWDSNEQEIYLNTANAFIHTAQLFPLVGLVTAPVELGVNFGVDYYDNYSDEKSSIFFDNMNAFDTYYYKALNETNQLFDNDSLTADEFRKIFYNDILLSYLSNLVGDENWQSTFRNFKNTDIPYTDAFWYKTIGFFVEDFDKVGISAYEMVANYYVMRIPIYLEDIGYYNPTLKDVTFNFSDTWSNNLIKLRLTDPLMKLSQSKFDLVSYLKQQMGYVNCDISFGVFSDELGLELSNQVRETCKDDVWKRATVELWLINNFEKKLKERKYDDWAKYLNSTLWHNRVKGSVVAKNDILFDNDNYLNFEDYSKGIKNSLEPIDLTYLKEGIDLNKEIEINLDKWGRIAHVQPNNQLFTYVIRDFSDVNTDSQAYPYIHKLFNAGIIQGNDGYFYPKSNVSNGEILAMATNIILRSRYKEELLAISNTNDITFSKYVTFLKSDSMNINIELLNGKNISDFESGLLAESATRKYVAKVISNLLQHGKMQFSSCISTGDSDWDDCSNYLRSYCIAKGYREKNIDNKIIFEFKPAKLMKRSEVAVVLSNTMDVLDGKYMKSVQGQNMCKTYGGN